MSERGSFTTEYIYCDKCLEAVKYVLIQRHKYLCSQVIQGWDRIERLPIVAGKVGGGYGGEEIRAFKDDFIPKIEALICHPVRIAVIAEDGEAMLTATPNKSIINDNE